MPASDTPYGILEQAMNQFLLTLTLLLLRTLSVNASDNISGYWVVPGGDAVISIETSNNAATMTVARTLEPGLVDKHNPLAASRTLPLNGLSLGSGFIRKENEWTGGELYDPNTGKRYKASMRLVDENHLQIRGYIGIPVLGRSQTWQRFAFFRDRMFAMLNITTTGE